MRALVIEPTWEAFRQVARPLLAEGAAPESLLWSESIGDAAQLSLLQAHDRMEPVAPRSDGLRVPRALIELGECVACHREPAAWPWLYRLLWRVAQGERNLLQDAADPDVVTLRAMERAVSRDAHKMTAFVRFSPVRDEQGERWVAWFEPRHRIVRRTASFFERRFPSMRWSILTPDESVHWDGGALTFTPGTSGPQELADDDLQAFWLTYYASTFNPARVRIAAMRAEMPVHYWRNMPETASIGALLRAAPSRVRKMVEQAGHAAEPSEPAPRSLPARITLREPLRHPAAVHDPPKPASSTGLPNVRVGVAGWDYPDWAGRVYPAGREGVDRLRWVASRFDLIEVNSTFYRPASERAARHWLERVADRPSLRFSAKLSRTFTHERGAWSDAEVAAVTRGMVPLLEAGRLLSLVIQFPWSFRDGAASRKHLARVVGAFRQFPLHVEMRHASWLLPTFHEWLREEGVGIINIDQPIFASSIEPRSDVTSRVAYVRLHGRNVGAWFRADATRDERYDYGYSPEELRPWLAQVHEMAAREDVDEVAVVFNNHYRAQAVHDAEWFSAALSQPGSAERPQAVIRSA